MSKMSTFFSSFVLSVEDSKLDVNRCDYTVCISAKINKDEVDKDSYVLMCRIVLCE